MLRLGIDDIGIFGIHLRLKSITTMRHKPIRVLYTMIGRRPRWATEAKVVLRATVDVIEGSIIVDGDFIKLCDGQISLEVPRLGRIPRLIDTAITTHQPVIRLVRVDPDTMVIDMLGIFSHFRKCLSSIHTLAHPRVHAKDDIGIRRIGDDLLIVITTRTMATTLVPAHRAIGTPV